MGVGATWGGRLIPDAEGNGRSCPDVKDHFTHGCYLSLFDGGGEPVTHWANVESLLAFQITLAIELLQHAVVPLAVEC